MTDLLTVGDVARRLGVPRARVDYALEKAGIQERGRAGILRLFAADQVPVIQAALGTVRVRASRSTREPGGADTGVAGICS